MADAVVTFLLENLLQLVNENVLIKGVDDDFKHLLEEVKRLKAFLDDAAKYQSESNQWKHLVEEIQRTVNRTEDIIDKFLVQAKLHKEKNKLGRFFDVSHLATVRKLAAEIKDIHDKVRELRQNNQQAFLPTPTLQMPTRGAHDTTQEVSQVIKRLVEGSEDLDVVPIVGMPGLGKTTLARKIYNYTQLSFEFFSIIWVYVGQNYKLREVYLNVLKGLKKRVDGYQIMGADGLAWEIRGNIAKGGKCLIVLDDIWEPQVVEDVKKVFPKNNKGHRILMTTRQQNVALFANTDPHQLKFLEEEESFELLERRVFGKGNCPAELEEVGKIIAGKCSGVPLAIVVIAGGLRGHPNQIDWLRVERDVVLHLYGDNHESCLKLVELSYNCLPKEMKTCFLYCGVFPRGFDILSWKLIRLWIAEGLIKPQQTYTLEETAEFYLNDLVNRNLVILTQKRSNGQLKTCRLHDMLHQFCRMEASKKWLFQEICRAPDQAAIPSIQDSDSCRRLCIQPSILDDFLHNKLFAEHVRSFYCFSSKREQIKLTRDKIELIHKAFPLIRVLDVESLKFLFSKDFNQLFHLRYVAISGDFKSLPPTFGGFWNLQTLIINTSTFEPILDIKADIWNMLQLRHLHSNIPAKLPSPASTTSKPSCLQTLSTVSPESCKKEVLLKACNLRKLSIQGPMEGFLDTKGGISNLQELTSLENLKLLNDVPYVFKALCLPPAFFRLVSTVKKLTLTNTRFSWSEADKLGMLETLEVLKLKEFAFTGESWKPRIGGFSQLQFLWIEWADLETWEASILNFPILRHLVLIHCDKLDSVPLGLADIHSLQEMRLENTSRAVRSAKVIRERKTSRGMKVKLSIFPPESTDSNATQGENWDIELVLGSWIWCHHISFFMQSSHLIWLFQ
ncbi:putative late blight resistance protein homolog R1A-3 isoform X2 [Lycium ferocissimum]|uniref:putative late blight resistance protein homolog R1A-3 isoform X2 n=1 Tax=Lycium ferocissimum TaxID=112874 RepID=UPI0028169897|nr:putative late blight resistance protein homolog R1A-3 isoform X2 [Lycium ferocissimum]